MDGSNVLVMVSHGPQPEPELDPGGANSVIDWGTGVAGPTYDPLAIIVARIALRLATPRAQPERTIAATIDHV